MSQPEAMTTEHGTPYTGTMQLLSSLRNNSSNTLARSNLQYTKLHSIAFPLDLNWLFFPLRLGTQRKNRCGFDWIGFRHVMKFGFFLLLAFFSYWHNMVQVEDGISSNLVLQCNLSPIFVTKQFIIKYRHRITKNK